MRGILLVLGLLVCAAPSSAQDARQILQQLRNGNEEQRMNAFFKLIEGRSLTGLAQHRQELVRELIALGSREQARLLDPTQRFTPEQMGYFSKLFEVTSAIRDPSALKALSTAAPKDLSGVMSMATKAGVSSKEMQIVMSGLIRLLSDSTFQSIRR